MTELNWSFALPPYLVLGIGSSTGLGTGDTKMNQTQFDGGDPKLRDSYRGLPWWFSS